MAALPPSSSTGKSSKKKASHFGPYLLVRTVGEGEFGKVKLAIDSRTEKEVAVKLLKKDRVKNTNDRKKIMREITMMQALDHPYIVSLLEVVETDAYIGLVLEYAPGGELFHYIMAQPNGYLKEPEGRRFFAQVISGVSYMHSLGIVHRDLKLENLLLGPGNNILISDLCGSPSYAAPELVQSSDYVGVSVDIWSCGVILYGMLCGYLPYDDDPSNPDSENIQLLYQYIRTTQLTYPTFISGLARSLMSTMLVPDPKYRAKMSDVMGHAWLAPEAEIFQEELVRRLKKFGYANAAQAAEQTQDNSSPDGSTSTVPDSISIVTEKKEERPAPIPMQRGTSVSSKKGNWFTGSVSETASQVSAEGRPSLSYSYPIQTTQERKLQIHSGALDKNALSSKEPLDLLMDLEMYFESKLNCVVENNGSGAGEYKLKLLKPRGVKIDSPNTVVVLEDADRTDSPAPAAAAPPADTGIKKSDVTDPKMNQIVSSFPVSLKSRIRNFVSSFGSGASKGYAGPDDSLAATAATQPLSVVEEEISFTVEIQKVKDMPGMYVVDFRRLKGDKWAFKRLYATVVGNLPL
ncbi:kinase-like protein [Rhizoclosmatium globosum]|uniref:Kinase-like protein n=1 Tax=Rhizoclosmatium globosum TaxID=329046 RepID=A0A1Y2BVP1_9FUNG|nr:kinase-like protein [Rhizoclosmatium globosum]|eukprot:ORY38831.1 kinase-like protein [Rhizoclosmatium globosum]